MAQMFTTRFRSEYKFRVTSHNRVSVNVNCDRARPPWRHNL